MQVLCQEVAALSEPVTDSTQAQAATTVVQKLPYTLGLSLLVLSLDEWQAALMPCLQRTLYHSLHIRYQISCHRMHTPLTMVGAPATDCYPMMVSFCVS